MRAADLSLRTSPRHWRTIDGTLRLGMNEWQQPLYAAVAEMQVSIEGDPRPAVRLGSMLTTMKSASPHEVQYGKSECELRGIALGLETAGFTPRAIALRDAPDALVTLDTGDVWVEHAEIVDPISAQYTGMMHDLDRDVKDDIDADPSAKAQAIGQHLEIRIGVCPTKSQVRDFRRKIVDFIRSGKHLAIPERTFTKIADEPFRSLATSMTRAPWNYKKPPYIMHIQAAAHSFGPMSLAPIALKRLDVKRKLAARYGVAPLWLVLTVTDHRGVWDETMTFLGSGCPAIAPYDRVIVCDPGHAIIWANGVMALRDMRTRRALQPI